MADEQDDESVKLVNQFFQDVVMRHEFKKAGGYVSPDVKVHLATGREVEGIEGLKRAVTRVTSGRSWSSLKLNQTAAVGGFVVAGWTAEAGSGLLRRMRRRQTGSAAAVFRTSEGRITEVWGLVPPPEEPEEEFEGDDDGDFVGGRPPGPKWTPPIPRRPKKPAAQDPDEGAP
jgi:hypothetical protein